MPPGPGAGGDHPRPPWTTLTGHVGRALGGRGLLQQDTAPGAQAGGTLCQAPTGSRQTCLGCGQGQVAIISGQSHISVGVHAESASQDGAMCAGRACVASLCARDRDGVMGRAGCGDKGPGRVWSRAGRSGHSPTSMQAEQGECMDLGPHPHHPGFLSGGAVRCSFEIGSD